MASFAYPFSPVAEAPEAAARLQPTAAADAAGLGRALPPRRRRWRAGATGAGGAVHAAVGPTSGEVSAISGATP